MRIPVIVGPTASGKSALAMELAALDRRIEIVSADSRLVYRGLDIGTAKPTASEREAVRHHMIDLVDPDQPYSAGRYADDAGATLREVIARGGVPLVVGGSGFYVRALFHGLAAPPANGAIVAELTQRLEREGALALHEELARVDPIAAAAHHHSNAVKTLRALACWIETGRPYSSFAGGGEGRRGELEASILAIVPPRDILYERVNRRVDEMMERGLLEEVEALRGRGFGVDDPGMRTVGYAESLAHLEGRLSREEMIAAIQQSTRRYAKRQITWLRGMQEGIDLLLERADDVERAAAWLAAVTGSDAKSAS